MSFTQNYVDGTTVEDVVRPVTVDGTWNWFFGRDKAFVNEQNSAYDQTEQVEESGDAPSA